MGLVIEGVAVPLEVEAGGPKAWQGFLKNPKGWHEKKAAELKEQMLEELRAGLDTMTVDELEAHAASVGAVTKSPKGKTLTKAELIESVVEKQTGGK